MRFPNHEDPLGEFTIPGLGKLVNAKRAARIGRIRKPKAINIEAKTTVEFRLAKAAKDAWFRLKHSPEQA